jgi:Ca-activated chloride channel family protein
MTAMAVAGRGNYYFVEHTSDLADIFGRELASLGDTVATDARLELTPAPGVTIEDAYGYRVDRDGGVVRVPIADLRTGESRKVVVDVRVDALAPGAMNLIDAKLVWRPVGEHQERSIDQQVAVTISDDAAAVAASRDATAERGVQEVELAKAVDQATDAYQHGDADKAKQILQAKTEQAAAEAQTLGDDGLLNTAKNVRTQADAAFAAPAGSGEGEKTARNMSYHLSR